MKTSLQKLGALVLALCLVFALGTAAAADDTQTAAAITNPTVTLGGIAEGDTVNAYRLISYNDSYNEYVYYSDFGTVLGYHRHNQDDTLDNVMDRMNDNEVAAVLGEYAALVRGGHIACTLPEPSASGTAGEDGNVALTLEPGYYLLLVETLTTNSRIYNPMSVFVRVKDGEVSVYGGGAQLDSDSPAMNAKSTGAPAITKRVGDNTGVGAEWKIAAAASVGETADFYVRVEIPKFTGISDLPTLTLTDKLDGLAYVAGSAKVYRAQDGELFADEVADALTETVGTYENGTQNVEFALNYGKLVSRAAGTVDVYIKYQAVVMPEAAETLRTVDAEAGTSEQYAAGAAVLTYATDLEPENVKTTAEADVTLYNYAFRLNKYSTEVDKDGNPKAVAGAGFTVYTDTAAKTPLKFVLDGEYYRPAMETETENAVTELAAPCLVRGLDVGTYYLTESTVPSGYYAPKGDFKLELTAKRDASNVLSGHLDSGTIVNLDDADRLLVNGSGIHATELNRFDFGLKNSSTPILPTTGGAGTALFTIGGVLLMAAAVWLFFVRRRRNGED